MEKLEHIFTKCVANGLDNNSVVYISGPMSGYPGSNREAFFTMERKISNIVRLVINPAKLPQDWSYDRQLEKDLADIKNSGVTHMVLMPGWNLSNGAMMEVKLAIDLGIKMVIAEHLMEIDTSCSTHAGLFCKQCKSCVMCNS